MASSLRHTSIAVFAVVLSLISFPVVMRAASDTPTRITAAANVTVREMPIVSAPAVAQIPLGTELVEAGPTGLDKTWIRVRLADGREGWLQASLAKPLDPVWRWPVFDRIIADRLSRKGDGFQANSELVAFIERVAPEYTDRDGRAKVELARWRALAAAAAAIPLNGAKREPYMSWVAARQTEVVYDDPSRRWMVSAPAIWNRHAALADTTMADDLAWFAVTSGLPGECEGFLPCYIAARDRQYGEYLRRHPVGNHTTEAVDVVKQTAELLAAPAKPRQAFSFDPNRDCRDLTKSIDSLAAAVKVAGVQDRDATLASLAVLRKRC